MTTLHSGAMLRGRPSSRYVSRLHFAELDFGPTLPGTKALASWRDALGKDFVLSLVAPAALWGERDWPLRNERDVASELDRLGNVVHALAPKVLVLRSPPALRPGTAALERFRAVVARARKMAPVVAWDPTGMWSMEDAQREAEPLGLVVASDPLRDDVDGDAIVYARMRGIGADRRYHRGRLEDLWLALEGCGEAFVVFQSEDAEREAAALVNVAAGQHVADAELDEEDEGGDGDGEVDGHEHDEDEEGDGDDEDEDEEGEEDDDDAEDEEDGDEEDEDDDSDEDEG